MVGLVVVSRARELTSAGGHVPQHGDLCVLPCSSSAPGQCAVLTLLSPRDASPCPHWHLLIKNVLSDKQENISDKDKKTKSFRLHL